MATERDLCFTPAVELQKLYRACKTSPLEVMQTVLARIDAVNPAVNAIVTLVRDAALREARRATAMLRRGRAFPPLFGVPIGIKDVTPTKGIRTTYGSKLFESHVPDQDALVVERLRAAGAIVIGKTNTPEFAFGPNTVNSVFGGRARHGHVSARRGHRPERLASRAGVLLRGRRVSHDPWADPALSVGALAWDTYSVEGPMARAVADAALMLSVMAGNDERLRSPTRSTRPNSCGR
jgi:amidase